MDPAEAAVSGSAQSKACSAIAKIASQLTHAFDRNCKGCPNNAAASQIKQKPGSGFNVWHEVKRNLRLSLSW